MLLCRVYTITRILVQMCRVEVYKERPIVYIDTWAKLLLSCSCNAGLLLPWLCTLARHVHIHTCKYIAHTCTHVLAHTRTLTRNTHAHLHTHTGKHNYIAIGVCNEAYPTDSLPGWKPTSIGFHTDNGSLFTSSDHPTRTSSPCKRDDVIRCKVLTFPGDPTRIIVQFFKNGEKITQVPMPQPPGGLYGVIGMMGGGEKIALSPPMVTKQAEFDQLWEVSTPHTLQHAREGVCVYTGMGNFTHDSIGTVRAKYPVDPSGPLDRRSFEVRIIEPGEHKYLSLIHIWRCRRSTLCRSRWSPYH